MNRKMVSLLGLISCAAVALSLCNIVPGDEPRKSPSDDVQKLGDGILVLDVVKGSGIAGRETVLMTDASLVKIGDRYFVRGKGFITKDQEDDPDQKWFKGVNIAVAMETITEFYDMLPQQFEEYRAAFKTE
jgi:hypothetical protein